MALPVSQRVMLSVSLALCACILIPRIFGGGGRGTGDPTTTPNPQRMSPSHAGTHRESQGKDHIRTGGSERKTHSTVQQMKNVMEQELKKDKANVGGRSIAFTLMPLYAIGVAVFAAYKFAKLKTKDGHQSQKEKEAANKKTKQTEMQLLELESHLSQTEQMLNTLLMQLDPLSNCVNTLGNEQKADIMNRLQSIRRLIKESGMDKSALSHPANQTCSDELEDLIHSFKKQESNVCARNDASLNKCEKALSDTLETDVIQHDGFVEDLNFHSSANSQEDDQFDVHLMSDPKCDGLRQRLIKD
ncbi:coiled-coil domain-containing protein 107 [Discoglossus pictus]